MLLPIGNPASHQGASAAPKSLEGKLAVITGASRGMFPMFSLFKHKSTNSSTGIGATIAQKLASKGCAVVLNYSSPKSSSQCTSLATELENEHPVKCLAIQADMSSISGPAELIRMAKEHFPATSPFRVDIIVNNAGVVRNATIENTDPTSFDWMYQTNVRGPLLLVKAAMPYLPHERSGRVVNVSSISSTEGLVEQSVYAGTKAALEAMTRSWAREFSERCTVNAINPGPVATSM